MLEPQTLEEALAALGSEDDSIRERHRWKLLSIILRNIAQAQGVALDWRLSSEPGKHAKRH